MITTFLLAWCAVTSQEASGRPENLRTVEILVPSITCHSRFQESLQKNIVGPSTWIRSVRLKNLNQRVLAKRPKYDFGNDLLLSFEVDDRKTARELAEKIRSSGYYGQTDLWVLKSGHKMKDRTMISFADLLRKK